MKKKRSTKEKSRKEEAEMDVDDGDEKMAKTDTDEDFVDVNDELFEDPNKKSDDDDEKEDKKEEDVDEGEENMRGQKNHSSGDNSMNAFLDTFYGLCSADSRERAHAAQQMIHSCLLGNDANSKDAGYALKRLLNGLCSGRAAARQGNASALSTFLKISVENKMLEQIQKDELKSGEGLVSDFVYIRRRLLDTTDFSDNSQGGARKKAAEEKDYKFGRLFGILGIVRSGILLPKESIQTSDIIEISSNFLKDLAKLYAYKKWIREPVAHAVGTLLNSYFATCSTSPDSIKIVNHLVENVVVPELLLHGDNEDKKKKSPFVTTYSAEQMAIALNIQSHVSLLGDSLSLPKPIDVPILTKDTLPLVASVLSETSSVIQPRHHLVWDALCLYLTEPAPATSSKSLVEVRIARKQCPVGNESVDNLLDSVVRHVILERLLGIDPDQNGYVGAKTTHDRTALALCIVRNLSGVEFISSITGRTTVVLNPETIENVLINTSMIKPLFINVMHAGFGKGKGKVHLLRPMADSVLESIPTAMYAEDVRSEDSEENNRRRLAFIRPLLTCDPRFEKKTKSFVISQLLGLEQKYNKRFEPFWNEYLTFLENRVALASLPQKDESNNERVTESDAQAYIELLFYFAKTAFHVSKESDGNALEYYKKAIDRVFGFLMAAAFFDCTSVKSYPAAKLSCLPYSVRVIASARFFTLLADLVIANGGRDKERVAHALVSDTIQSLKDLEASGAKSLAEQSGAEEESSDSKVRKLRKKASKLKPAGDDSLARASNRFTIACSLCASLLSLQRLSCGESNEIMKEDDPDADDEADNEAALEFIDEVLDIYDMFVDNKKKKTEDVPLTCLAGFCANLLSSPLCSGSLTRGGSGKLFKEIIKMLWTSGLQLSASQSPDSKLDKEALTILLGSMGAKTESSMEEDDSDDEHDEGDDNRSLSSNEQEALDNEGGGNMKEGTGIKDEEDKSDDEDDDNQSGDLELDPSRLQSLLEEDSDASVKEGELEHHEGADAALARLISLKKEARKAGQLAKERIEIAKQLRCSILLETVLTIKPQGWGSLISSDFLLNMLVPLLQYRHELDRSLNIGDGAKSEKTAGEKRAMLERVNSILKSKILKFKFTGVEWCSTDDIEEYCSTLSSNLFTHTKQRRKSKDQRALCNMAVMVVIRSIPQAGGKINVADRIYGQALQEWATKRRSCIDSKVFDDLIDILPQVAQAVLVPGLAEYASGAEAAFLKSECFRLLTRLYNPKLNERKTEIEITAHDVMVKQADSVLEAVVKVSKDSEMLKAKRMREVLNGLEKVLRFIENTGSSARGRTSEIKDVLEKIGSGSESQGLSSKCNNLLKLIGTPDTAKPEEQEASESSKAQETSEHSEGDAVGDVAHDEDDDDDANPASKKSKPKKQKKQKKKSKKKRR